ncbi:MAG: nucleoside recognition domain-containing protein [Oscillospiraceae bacterium]|nr:nucleoside recognition domain-containing protein [Oscillospiraceae bacterium]
MNVLSKFLSNRHVADALAGLAILCIAIALVMFPKESVEAAKSGITLSANVIIPSLFPFFVLSTLLVDLGLANYFGKALERIMRPFFNLSGSCSSALALGLIGGYPVGAKTAISLFEKGLCTREEAERMLSFCNNSGPAFILGVVGAGVFSSGRIGILLYLAHAIASLFVGFMFRFYKSGKRPGKKIRPAPIPQFEAPHLTQAFTDAVKNAFYATLNICAFVIFFTVFIRLLFLSGVLPSLASLLGTLFSPFGFTKSWAEHLLTGFIEMTAGIWTLNGGEALAGRLSMAAFMLGWAGISVHCQVLSFIGNSGLSVRTYVAGKALHGVFSAVIIQIFLVLFRLDEPASSYLADQIRSIASMNFQSALTLSIVTAWSVWLIFLIVSFLGLRKRSGKNRKRPV